MDTGPAQDAEIMVDYEQLAMMIFQTSTGLMAAIIGPEWLPGKIKTPSGAEFEESLVVVKPLARYLEEKQMPDIPPLLAVVLAVAVYSVPRWKHENTRVKLGGFLKAAWAKIKSVFTRKKKTGPGAIVARPADTPAAVST